MGVTAAAISVEDVRRKFYESAGYTRWITDLQLDPLQLITNDETTGQFYRVPITLTADGFEFEPEIEVDLQYVDAQRKTKSNASAVTWASAADSRGSLVAPPAKDPPKAVSAAQAAALIHNAPAASKAAGSVSAKGEESGMDFAKLRELLGIADDLTDEDVEAKLAEAGVPAPASAPVVASATTNKPDQIEPVAMTRDGGAMLVDKAAWDQREERLRRLEAQESLRRKQDGERVIKAALSAGKIGADRMPYWTKRWDADPDGTQDVLEHLTPGVIVPTKASGYAGSDADEALWEVEFGGLFPRETGSGPAPKGGANRG